MDDDGAEAVAGLAAIAKPDGSNSAHKSTKSTLGLSWSILLPEPALGQGLAISQTERTTRPQPAPLDSASR